MKTVVTEADRKQVRARCWQQVRRLDLPRKDRMLLATMLELDFWERWRSQQEQA